MLNLGVKDQILESMNEKAETMRKRVVEILGKSIGKHRLVLQCRNTD